MVCADLNEGTFKENAEIAREVAAIHPYAEWLQGSQRLSDLGSAAWLQEPQMGPADALKLQARPCSSLAQGHVILGLIVTALPAAERSWLCQPARAADAGVSLAPEDRRSWLRRPGPLTPQRLGVQAANGLGQEDTAFIIEGMAQTGAEPTYCMGDDIPLPVLSSKAHPLYNYFKQRFAQARPAAARCAGVLEHPAVVPCSRLRLCGTCRCAVGAPACKALLCGAGQSPWLCLQPVSGQRCCCR